jgi:hypothetical protein
MLLSVTPRPFSWKGLRLAFVLSVTSMCSTPLGAQQDRPANAQLIVGCWKLEPGQFAVIGKTGVDRGQTVLPSLVQFDTMPGKSKSGEPIGRRVRTSAADSGSRYQEGYYLFSGADSVRVDWTTGFVGMTLLLRLDDRVMHGRASAWTDYGGSEEASLVLRRAVCPASR